MLDLSSPVALSISHLSLKWYISSIYQNVDKNAHGITVCNKEATEACSWLITGFVTRLTRRVPLVEQELLTFPGHLSSPSGFSGVRVPLSLVLYVCIVDRCLFFCTLSFGHCVVCSFLIYLLIAPLVSFGHCVVCSSSIYLFIAPLVSSNPSCYNWNVNNRLVERFYNQAPLIRSCWHLMRTLRERDVWFLLKINVRENHKGNQEWTVQRHWQHLAQSYISARTIWFRKY